MDANEAINELCKYGYGKYVFHLIDVKITGTCSTTLVMKKYWFCDYSASHHLLLQNGYAESPENRDGIRVRDRGYLTENRYIKAGEEDEILWGASRFGDMVNGEDGEKFFNTVKEAIDYLKSTE